MNLIEILSSHNIPTQSTVKAIQFVNGQKLSDNEYKSRLIEMVGEDVEMNGQNLQFTYLYFVQSTIKAHINGDTLSPKSILKSSLKQATSYLAKNGWALKTDVRPVDINGNVKPKKGVKKEMAVALYNKRKHENMTRKEWIALLVAEVNLTEMGASTYYANLKAGRYS